MSKKEKKRQLVSPQVQVQETLRSETDAKERNRHSRTQGPEDIIMMTILMHHTILYEPA